MNYSSPFSGYCRGLNTILSYNDDQNTGTISINNAGATGSIVNNIAICDFFEEAMDTHELNNEGLLIRKESYSSTDDETEIITYTILSTESVSCK